MRRIAITFATWALTLALAGRLAAAETTNHCELTTTGDTTVSIKANAPSSAARAKHKARLNATTDYWMTDAELRAALAALANPDVRASPADKQRKLDEAMKKDPRLMVLTISCMTEDGGVIFMAPDSAKYADVPFKRGSYSFAAMLGGKGGQLNAMFSLSSDKAHESYAVQGLGKLVLTQFDKKGIAGTFTFKAESRDNPPKHITVNGKFSYACIGGACKK